MTEIAGQFALVVAAQFAGTAVYVSAVEHPARLRLDDKAALTGSEVKNAVHHNGSCFARPGFCRGSEVVEFPGPRDLQIPGIVAVDLIER